MSLDRRKEVLIFLVTFGTLTFFSLNWHSHRAKFNYHSEIWGDRAGYHVFLPAMFEYGFDADHFPPGIDKRTGNGFDLDSIPHKVLTKYTCGEALLRTPFYLLGTLFRNNLDAGGPGFTQMDHAMINVAAAFFCTVGLWLLHSTLRRRYRSPIAIGSLAAILTGTNLLFYTVGDSGMTHVYSFFLFASWTYLIDRASEHRMTTMRALVLGATAGLIILVRPTNIIFIPIPLFFLGKPWATVRSLLMSIKPSNLALMLLGGTLIWVPQLAYWTYAFGSPVVWSYGHEGFSNLLTPQLIPFWFAPYNGVFAYAPLLLVILISSSLVAMDRKVKLSMWAAFIAVSYVCSAWFAWSFGCGFGSRNFVEYSPLFAFTLAGVLGSLSKYNTLIRIMVVAACIYTTKLTLSCSNCWFGDTWDWKMYFDLLLGPLKV